jgi:hypothetical protein
MAGRKIEQLKADLAVKPEILDARVDARTEDFRRGPVKITRKTETKPDGTKTTEQTREIAAEERHVEAVSEATHKETPVFAPQAPARTRYVGVGVNPLDYTRQWRGRAGLNVLGAVDAGVAVDLDPVRLNFDRPMLELGYRF